LIALLRKDAHSHSRDIQNCGSYQGIQDNPSKQWFLTMLEVLNLINNWRIFPWIHRTTRIGKTARDSSKYETTHSLAHKMNHAPDVWRTLRLDWTQVKNYCF